MKLNSKSMIGESALMLDLADHISRVAVLDKPVLVIGERGTGKELVAERLHYLSRRWDQSFLKVNCAAMTESLLESELFGHEAGAFTGASKRHLGRFERAEGGSLFMDELGTCSLRVQEKLLRVIEYGEYERIGGQTTLQADVRLIAATNADLPLLADSGEFRADLLDRLAFDVVHIPPLRYRQEDILLLAEHFALSMCLELGRSYFAGFSDYALDQLRDYSWPGNVRELRNAVERSIYRQDDEDELLKELLLDPFAVPWAESKEVPEADEPSEGGQTTGSVDKPQLGFAQQVAEFERGVLLKALKAVNYNQRDAAEALNMTYHQLRAQLKKQQMLPLRQFLRKNTVDIANE